MNDLLPISHSWRAMPLQPCTVLLFVWLLLAVPLLAPGSVRADERGAQLFVQCKSCHAIDVTEVEEHFGPPLQDLFGRVAGSMPDYDYSDALRQAGTAGLIWNDQTLDALLADPQGFLPGLRMPIAPIADAADRQSLIRYLAAVYAVGGPTIAVHDDPPVPEGMFELRGDPEYGAYLASECLTCHQADGSQQGIPAIVGWAPHRFIRVMNAYRVKGRDNSVMQSVAGALGDEEIAALASYFAQSDR